jgi:stage III sporulation protein AH
VLIGSVMMKLKLTTFKSPLILGLITLITTNLISIVYIHQLRHQIKQDYFIQQRITRKEVFNRSIKTYKSIIDDKNISSENKELPLEKYKNLVSSYNTEAKIEAILRAKGFDDAFAAVADERATVSVRKKARKLSDREAKFIKDVLIETADIKDIEAIQKE